ncbi:MAG: VCBS repeat-containing protein, partial [Chloroflexota bacterium]|nr:VCBS repeat-containing protein [Chloroflexota bacterium]
MDFIHQGSFSKDRLQTPLLPHTLSNLGPALARGDVNSDGLMDLFLGGGEDQAPSLFLQQSDGAFTKAVVPAFEQHKQYEDVDAIFFDALGNGHLDLYVVSGGNFDPTNGPFYQDRLYLNDGFGNFAYARDALPSMETSGGSVTLLDIEGDGDSDLFVGGRVVTGNYPMPPRSYLLQNNSGTFTDVTGQASQELLRPGMVSDAAWADIDNDQQAELIIAGEWMPVRIFKSSGNLSFREITMEAGLGQTSGWWGTLEVADMNGDGSLDIVAGNRGLNTSLQPTPAEPVIVYAGDFDGNGSVDPIITAITSGER